MKHIELYTDGASKGNPGDGGWGAVLRYQGVEKRLNGYAPAATNNQMELTAAIEGLKALTQPCQVTLWIDSVYVKNGITQWIDNWKRNGWKTASKKPVKNQALWQSLDALQQQHQIDWRWIKGHAGHEGNELADQLANEAIVQAKTLAH